MKLYLVNVFCLNINLLNIKLEENEFHVWERVTKLTLFKVLSFDTFSPTFFYFLSLYFVI